MMRRSFETQITRLLRWTSFAMLLLVVSLHVEAGETTAPIISSHPRLLLDWNKLNWIKLKAAKSDPDWLQLKAEADKLAPYKVLAPHEKTQSYTINAGYRGSGYVDATFTLGLAYQITGDPRYADKVLQILAALDNAGLCVFESRNTIPCGIDSSNGYPMRTYAVAMAIGYDWIYDRISPEQRASFSSQLAEWVEWCGTNCYKVAGPGVSNFFSGSFIALAFAGYATWGDNPRANEYISAASQLFQSQVVAEVLSGGSMEGGSLVEGWGYGTGTADRYLMYLLAVKSATGLMPGSGTQLAETLLKGLVYSLKPNRWQVIDEGEWGGDYAGVLARSTPLLLTEVLSGAESGKHAQFFFQNLKTAPVNVFKETAWERVLWHDSTRTVADYRAVWPTAHRARGNELFLDRSDWSDEAVWLSFMGGAKYFSNHESRDAGSFTIQRGNDYLVVDGGQFRSPNGYYGSALSGTTSARENTLYFDDHNEYLATDHPSYDGGQGSWGSHNVLRYESAAYGMYVKADLSDAYDNRPDRRKDATRSLLHFQRSLLYLRPETIFVYDVVRTRKSTYDRRFRVHLSAQPVQTGSGFWVDRGTSRLYANAVLPERAALSTSQLILSSGKPGPWRADIAPSAPEADSIFLTVLIPTANTTLTTPLTKGLTSKDGKLTGAYVDHRGQTIAMFSKDVSGAFILKTEYEVPSSGEVKHIICGLQPSAKYNIHYSQGSVTVEMSSTGSTLSSPEGVLVFKTDGQQAPPPAIGAAPPSNGQEAPSSTTGQAPFSQSATGIYRGGLWVIDGNRNSKVDSSIGSGDRIRWFTTGGREVPIAADWNGDGVTDFGLFKDGQWIMDKNGDGTVNLGSPGLDQRFQYSATPGDLPVTGDWNGDGYHDTGIFRNGAWFLDVNGDGVLTNINQPGGDRIFQYTATLGDIPVSGDWNGDGKWETGIFRNGAWFLDVNGDGVLTNINQPGGDRVFQYSATPGDLPVVGKW